MQNFNVLSTNYEDFKKFLKKNNVYDEITYNKLEIVNEWKYCIGNIRNIYKQFCFRDIHPNNTYFYWTKGECEDAQKLAYNILKIKYSFDKIRRMNNQQIINELHEINNKIPNINPRLYYPE